MTKLCNILFLSQWLVPAAIHVYTGFNYGAFWSYGDNVKYEADFAENFMLAKSLNASVTFDSARLFTCKPHGTLNDPTEAFDAAIATNTSLLLGFWVSPAVRGDLPDEMVDNEMIALEKGFERHGQALSDLIIGLSVGNEDICRWNHKLHESGLAADTLSKTISKVKEDIAASSFARYMEGKPIGHVDTAQYVVVDGDVADFVGMTAYPYWNNKSIEDAKASFLESLKDVRQRAGDTPIWIAEMGWPFEGPQRGEAIASAENYQKYWTEVGCSVFGKYNTFWFELSKDTQIEQPDGDLFDIPSGQPRIKDLFCPGFSDAPTLPSESMLARPSEASLIQSQPGGKTSTITIITTISVPPPPVTTLAAAPSIPADKLPWCVTVADIAWNGQYVPVAANAARPDGKCSPAPTYTGLPYGASETMVCQSYSSSEGSMPAISTWAPSLEMPVPSKFSESSQSGVNSQRCTDCNTAASNSTYFPFKSSSSSVPHSTNSLSSAVGFTSVRLSIAPLRPTGGMLPESSCPKLRSALVKRW